MREEYYEALNEGALWRGRMIRVRGVFHVLMSVGPLDVAFRWVAQARKALLG